MSAVFTRFGTDVLLDLDVVEHVALVGIVADARAHADSGELRQVAHVLAGHGPGGARLSADDVGVWACALGQVGGHLSASFSLGGMLQDAASDLVATLAVEGPLATAARAHLWVSSLRAELAALT